MKAKFSVMLMWWVMVIALPVSVPSVLFGAQPSAPGLVKLPKLLKPSKILSFSSIEALKSQPQQIQTYPGAYQRTQGVAAANVDKITDRIWEVSLNDGLDPSDNCVVAFVTDSLRITGSSSASGVTVTVTANILKQQQPANAQNIVLRIDIYKDGNLFIDKGVLATQTGSLCLTSDPFTMEPNHDYQAWGAIECRSTVVGETVSVIAEITGIKWTL